VRTFEELLQHYQHVIEDLTLVTGTKGVFDVEVDGELIYSKGTTGRHARPGEVLELFRARLGSDVEEYER
jgi:predicted Rdx family selenoprotein